MKFVTTRAMQRRRRRDRNNIQEERQFESFMKGLTIWKTDLSVLMM